MNLLLAEDDAVARLTLSAVLKGLGYEVTEAEHGGEAWANLQLGYFPIIISDWQMPEVDGPELCRRLRARATDRYSYFLLVTATGGKKRYLEGMEAGADDFITKPIDMDELRARLKAAERILGLRQHDLRVLQAHPGCCGKMGIDRALCRSAIPGTIQSRVLSRLLREVRAAAD
jgi:DNA-binding response OmpR family regulator